METHKIAIKRPGCSLEPLSFDGTYRCDVKPLLNGKAEGTTLEYVMLRQTPDGRCLCMVCDENGRYKQLPYNFSMITKSGSYKFLSQIVGTVVFVCYRWEDVWAKEIYDFELLDLNDDELSIINTIFADQYQQRVKEMGQKDPTIHDSPVFTIYN